MRAGGLVFGNPIEVGRFATRIGPRDFGSISLGELGKSGRSRPGTPDFADLGWWIFGQAKMAGTPWVFWVVSFQFFENVYPYTWGNDPI